MCEDVGNVRRMEDAGAAAVVLHSLFEEQIDIDNDELDRFITEGSETSAEATSHFPETDRTRHGPGRLSEAHREVQAGRQDPDHRQPQRHHHAAAGSATPNRWSRPAPTRSS